MITHSNKERRDSVRFQSLNLLTYYEKSGEGEIVSQGIAKTLDLSVSGALVALANPITHPDDLEMDIALEEELIRVKAQLIEQWEDRPGVWHIRLKFDRMRPAQKHLLAAFLRSIR
ncbi:PilZ domain-containing protein [bacterium]|nr:PilZ domain-containing protein [candidate division CSSED10-310 bacterium]